MLWNDIGYPAAADLPALFDRYYAAVPDGVVNNRFDWMAQSSGSVHCDFVTPEYSTVGDPNRKWESTRGIGTSFGYNRVRARRPATSIPTTSCACSSTSSPTAATCSSTSVRPPRASSPGCRRSASSLSGGGCARNGDAIYGTRPWSRTDGTTGEGHDVRYTTRDGAVYAIVCGTPAADRVALDVVPAPGADVHLLGHDAPLAWTASGEGSTVTLPGRPAAAPALTLRLSATA